jgi:hypothetical protein
VFETAEEASAAMQSPDFAANPFGVDFVVEDIEKRLAAGESVKSVLARPPSGPRGPETVPLLAH